MNKINVDTELKPTWYFTENFKEGNQEISAFSQSENDPPDFILQFDKKEISLEVTSIVDSNIYELNNLFSEIESTCYEYAEKHRNILPSGKYLFYFYPGGKDVSLSEGGSLTVPDFSKKSRKTVRAKEIDRKIKKLFINISEGKDRTVQLLNKRGEVFGRIFCNPKTNYSETQYYFFPQRISVSSIFEKEKFQSLIQSKIDEKECNYLSRGISKENEWWLLLSDIDNDMNTGLLGFDLKDIVYTSTFFDRIFFIRRPYVDCLIDELDIER